MRGWALLGVAALLTSACSHVTRFEPASGTAQLPGHPRVGEAEVAGVRLIARPGAGQDWPTEIQDQFTPVRIGVENHSGKTLVLAPALFGLVAPGGIRYAALEPDEAQSPPAQNTNPPTAPGHPPPGAGAPAPGAGSSGPVQNGRLEDGARVAGLLFFPVPASRLSSLELTFDLVDAATTARIGTIRLAFVQEGVKQAQPVQPQPAPQPPASGSG